MIKIHVTALVALSALALPLSTALAQKIFGLTGVDPTQNDGRATENANVPHCGGSAGGSRVRENCEPERVTAKAEQELKLSIQVPARVSKECNATTTTEYMQLNTVARINSRLHVSDCAVASGGFRIAVRLRDENGAEQAPLEFNETWQRSGDKDVDFARDYQIGEAELLSVRVRGLTCTCADVATENAEGSATVVEQPSSAQ